MNCIAGLQTSNCSALEKPSIIQVGWDQTNQSVTGQNAPDGGVARRQNAPDKGTPLEEMSHGHNVTGTQGAERVHMERSKRQNI